MQTKYPTLFLLILSIYVCRVSLELGLGTLHKPGSGFIPFGSGIFLGILALIMLIQNIGVDKANRSEEKKEKTQWRAVVLTFVALFISILIFERLGFILSTTLFVGFLFKCIEKKGWFITILASLILTLTSYYIFKVLLHAELPKGIFGL